MRVIGWYDSGWGHASRLADRTAYVGARLAAG